MCYKKICKWHEVSEKLDKNQIFSPLVVKEKFIDPTEMSNTSNNSQICIFTFFIFKKQINISVNH